MFALYAIPIGLILGRLLGGRVSGVASLHFRWASLAVLGLVVQVLLFAGPIAERIGAAGPPIYIASSAVVLVALLRNLDIAGLGIVAVGACANLAAIVANGGSMPASPEAMAALDKSIGSAYSNSVEMQRPALALLTDIFAMPPGLPFANVFSIGDVLIAVGMVVTIVLAMRDPGVVRSGTSTRGHPPTVTVGPWRRRRSSHTVAAKVKNTFR